ncbi:hypothetical protein CJP72_10070 [Citrobacter sp. NCU1]|uniref:tetratricopeptide repeat protein n=1 Tax=Citrobacter sp. NCU1 TaxID=2026683 RepID=UPI001391D23A|nr:tetratricopeptide repeat protein [Citrobacter sp. NCU1]NDO81098.1 hypothetical protein [Citrobacter sp. NCU1]
MLSIAAQLFCAFHVVRSGHDRYWIFIILVFPAMGCLIYLLFVVLPGMGSSYHGRSLMLRIMDKISPERHLRKMTEELAIAETNQNHYLLANELARLGRYHQAIPHYQQALSGIFAHEAPMMLSLAKAEFATQDFAGCQKTLEDLIHFNPDFQSSEGHLLYARALAAQENYAVAEPEFEELIRYYPGPQARVHYAEMLVKSNRLHDANAQYVAIIDAAKHARPQYRKYHREWIKIANEKLKQGLVQ